jgi:hypothetical protein
VRTYAPMAIALLAVACSSGSSSAHSGVSGASGIEAGNDAAGGLGGSGTVGGFGGTNSASGGAGGVAGSVGDAGGAGPGPTLTHLGRWFYYNGSPIYLIGVDMQPLISDPTLDYAALFAELRTYKINKVRVWLDAYWAGSSPSLPWAYDSTTGKFDLDTWNSAFWSRVSAVVASARQN